MELPPFPALLMLPLLLLLLLLLTLPPLAPKTPPAAPPPAPPRFPPLTGVCTALLGEGSPTPPASSPRVFELPLPPSDGLPLKSAVPPAGAVILEFPCAVDGFMCMYVTFGL